MRVFYSIALVLIGIVPASTQDLSTRLEIPFDHLKVSGNIHLELVKSNIQQLVVSAEESSELLETEVKDGTLSLKSKSELSNSSAVRAALHYVSLSGIEILKGGRVQSADTLRSDFLQLDVLSGGKAELTIHVDTLDIRVNQGSDIILYGVTNSQNVNAYSWGNYLAYDLVSNETRVKAATGAQVKITALFLLDANSTSKAFIGYKGEPEHKKLKTSVGGEITSYSE